MNKKILLLFISLPMFLFSQNMDSLIVNQAKYYKDKYKVSCVEDKITDNQGNGFEGLYGTRNFRPILHGIAYRGGGNNYYQCYHYWREGRKAGGKEGLSLLFT